MTENANKEGRVLWITGLSGSGKSTIATATAEILRANGEHPVVLDGDAVRAAIADSKNRPRRHQPPSQCVPHQPPSTVARRARANCHRTHDVALS